MVLDHILNIVGIFGIFCVTDNILCSCSRLKGVYYLMHAIHNMLIVRATLPDVIYTWTRFGTPLATQNMAAFELVFALHLYHIFMYYRKFRMDDWIHHILMIGIAMPLGGYFSSGSLLGYSLFFTTGLPGGIDYILLFLVRNNWLARETEKSANAFLNVWVRSPGCVSLAGYAICYAYMFYEPYGGAWWAGIITAVLTFWNGQYFMRQILSNAQVQAQAVHAL
jgi:hypothetical protein